MDTLRYNQFNFGAIGAALYGQLLRRRDRLGDEVFGGGDEVVKDVLLVQRTSTVVPGIADSPSPRRLARS